MPNGSVNDDWPGTCRLRFQLGEALAQALAFFGPAVPTAEAALEYRPVVEVDPIVSLRTGS